MRVRVIFSLKNRGSAISFHHQFIINELVDELMAGSSFEDYDLYNYSGLKGQTKVSKMGLHFYSSKITLVISSVSEDFLQELLKRLFKRKMITLGELQLIPDTVERERYTELKRDSKYICLSPLVLISPSEDSESASVKRFIPPTDDSFSDLVYESTMERMEESDLFTDEQISSFYQFQLLPDLKYLQKIKEADKKFARIYPVFYNQEKREVRGYTFPFQLLAAPEVHEFVFNCGLGALTHKGFGMLDIAHSDPNQRTEPYEIE